MGTEGEGAEGVGRRGVPENRRNGDRGRRREGDKGTGRRTKCGMPNAECRMTGGRERRAEGRGVQEP